MMLSDAVLGQTESHLIRFGQHQLDPDTACAFSRLRDAALADGQSIAIASSFRSFSRQLAIWNRKWLGELPLFDIDNHALDVETLSEQQKLYAILTWSALPGTSRHHWGTDIDVYDDVSIARHSHRLQLIPSEYSDAGPCASLNAWLDEHASEFGFYRPYGDYRGGVAAEPWHLSHIDRASHFDSQRNKSWLEQAIRESDIQGKAIILQELDIILSRYVNNIAPLP